MNSSISEFAGLKCRIFDHLQSGQKPSKLVVLCHGFGAPGDDLASFAPFMINDSQVVAATCRFVFPEAPIDLTSLGIPGGRAWWPINMARLAEINQTREFDKLATLQPDGMLEASQQLYEAVELMRQADGLEQSSVVFGGFSQGAMISTDIALRHHFQPAHLILFSGTLLCRDDWTAFARSHPGCHVLQTHGRQDMVLPYEPSEWLRDLLMNNGFSVNFQAFDGPHTIPMEPLAELVRLLENGKT